MRALLTLILTLTVFPTVASADEVHDADLKDVHVTIADALKVSESVGTPLSAKFELEGGRLHLSVYTMKGDAFTEVVIDYKNGKILETEAMDQDDELAEARAEAAAIAKAKTSLRAAVDGRLAASKGSRAVSAAATLDGGRPVAKLVLVKGAETSTVAVPLD